MVACTRRKMLLGLGATIVAPKVSFALPASPPPQKLILFDEVIAAPNFQWMLPVGHGKTKAMVNKTRETKMSGNFVELLGHPPKWPSTPHWPWSETVHSDDTTLNPKDAEAFVGQEVVITEKLDGGNTCLWNGKAYARSTGQEATAGWFAMVKKHHSWKTSGEEEICFYGEDLYGIHSIEYDAMKEDETYRVFATRNVGNYLDFFHNWDYTVRLSELFGFITVPLLFRGRFNSVQEITSWFSEERKKPSALGGEREGFVMRVARQFTPHEFSQVVTKYVRAGHVQTDEHWTKNWQPCKIVR